MGDTIRHNAVNALGALMMYDLWHLNEPKAGKRSNVVKGYVMHHLGPGGGGGHVARHFQERTGRGRGRLTKMMRFMHGSSPSYLKASD